MADSTLDLSGEETPGTTLGHGTSALGPSDSSDSGSDVMGGPGMDEGLSDDQSREMPQTIHTSAGRDLGDVALDSDTDRAGTGERGAAGVDDATSSDQSLTIHDESDVGDETVDETVDDPDAAIDTLDATTGGDDGQGDDDDGLDDVPVADGAT